MESLPHIPVLKEETLSHLNIIPNGKYLDCTLGAGGHSLGILKKLNSSGMLIGIDSDEKNLQPTHTQFSVFKNIPFSLHHDNFNNFPQILKMNKILKLNGILLDLGLSSMELDDHSRGFSYQINGPLDMRFNIKKGISASQLIKKISENEISRIIKEFGEEKKFRAISKSIKKYVKAGMMNTTFDLKQSILDVVPTRFANKSLARVFQAIRIAVNDELSILKTTLEKTTSYLKSGGRIVVISYHSLEDRIVKNLITKGNFEGMVQKDFFGNSIKSLKAINKKVIVPTEAEIKDNSRSRSGKLRIAEKIHEI